MQSWEEIESIKRLKYRYTRLFDSKQWEALTQLFAEDCTSAYDNGRFAYQGREAVLAFLVKPMVLAKQRYSKHHVHQPEIDLLDENHARGIWYLDDKVLDYKLGTIVTGTAIYYDRYTKIDGEWRIQHIGYQRIWMRLEKLDNSRVIEARTMFDEAERQRSRERPKFPDEAELFRAWD